MNNANTNDAETVPITRDMLENAFRGVQDEINKEAPSTLAKAAYVASALALLLVALAYIAGRRIGRKRSTLVEIKRF